jgi:hypothetical protein
LKVYTSDKITVGELLPMLENSSKKDVQLPASVKTVVDSLRADGHILSDEAIQLLAKVFNSKENKDTFSAFFLRYLSTSTKNENTTLERVKVIANFDLSDERFVNIVYRKNDRKNAKPVTNTIIIAPRERKVLELLYEKAVCEEVRDRILPEDSTPYLSQAIYTIRKKINDKSAIPIERVRGLGYVMHVLGAEEAKKFRKHYGLPHKEITHF